MLSLGHANYWIYVVIMMIGFYGVIARHNMVKKVIALGIFQTGIFLLYISMGVIEGGVAPIHVDDPDAVYTNPIPHVLILTAIVVSLAIMSVALAISSSPMCSACSRRPLPLCNCHSPRSD